MPKIQETKRGQFFITLTKQLANALGWEKGDILNLNVENGDIVIKNLAKLKNGKDKKRGN